MAPVKAATPAWLKSLRSLLKAQLGGGWSLSEQSGKTKVTYRFGDDSRSSVLLPDEFRGSNSVQILQKVEALNDAMRDRGISLHDAHKLLKLKRSPQADSSWQEDIDLYFQSRAHLRKTTNDADRTVLGNLLEALEKKPKPQSGKELMQRYGKLFFERCPAGEAGRQEAMKTISRFLTYRYEKCNGDKRWLPCKGDDLLAIVGVSDRTAKEKITPPISNEDLVLLLDSLAKDRLWDLWLAVGLLGLFGLRPAELGALYLEGDELFVRSDVKRNKQTMRTPKADRRVLPIDIPERAGLGQQVLEAYASGRIQLPQRLLEYGEQRDFKKAGSVIKDRLKHYKPWLAMVKRTEGLVPYSLRHSYAYRAHQSYGQSLPVPVICELMGHTPATHWKHYGRWVFDDGVKAQIDALVSSGPRT